MPLSKEEREAHERDPEGLEWATLSRLTNLDGKRVLEVGCGDGWLTSSLAAQARNVVGIDPDEEAVAVAHDDLREAGNDQVWVLAGAGEHLPFGDESFDTAVFSWSL